MQSKQTTKLWVTLGLATTLSSGCSKQEEPAASMPAVDSNVAASPAAPAAPVDFAKALEKLLAGEGGEGGTGLNYQDGKLVIAPLSGEHIKMALSGNSFKRGEDIALDFKADGTFTGAEHPWIKKETALCEKAGETKEFHLDDGQCYQRVEVTFPDGKWSVKGDQLCTTPALPQAAENLECTQVFVAIDRIALFSAEGAMLSKGIELVKGPVAP